MQASSEKNLKRLAMVGLVLLGVFLLGQILFHGFVDWDDRENIFQNPMLIPVIDWQRIWTSFELGSYYPLTLSFWALLKSIFGIEAFPFHLADLVLHFLNVFLVWSLLRRLFSKDQEWLIFAVTFLFALHPLQIETVSWVTETKTLLCSCFMLGSMNLYLRWRESNRVSLFLFSFLLAILAFLSKPLAMTLPVWIFAFELWQSGRIRWKTLISFAALSIISVFVETSAQKTTEAIQSQGFSLYRPLASLAFYTAKFFHPQGLVIFYDPLAMNLSWPDIIVATVFWILIAALFLYSESITRKKILAAACIFIGGLAPTLGFVSFGALSRFNDRYCYLPLVGLALLFCFLLQKIKKQIVIQAGFALAMMVMCLLTWRQVQVWENSGTLWQNVIASYPETAKAHLNLGLYLTENKQYDKAVGEYQEAMKLDPSCYRCRTNLAVVFANVGQASTAIQLDIEALEQQPNDIAVIANVGNLYAQLGNKAEAKKYLERAQKLNPKFPTLESLQKLVGQ